MINANEYELVRRLLLSETAAFDTLYHKYHNPLYFNILKLTKDAEAARDILQDVFITLWKQRMTLDPQQSILPWLFVVSYNKSVDYLKRTSAESALVYETQGLAQVLPGEAELKEAQLQLLEEAIRRLSPQKRKVFVLCKLQGKSYEETAEEMHISKHTVKEYLSGALVSIKGYVQQHPDYYTGCLIIFLLAQ
ncbi:MAG: sigma-70 family RNA polymerase sigma factor [Bacteroidetes bacterium]|nr:sigma-70 family RNA polymerase sigma factor [Bacteroidota bacterium]